MTLADRIKAGMAHSGISQAELARACGVKPPSVSGWLNGKSKFLRGENLLKAARALKVDQDWLATGKGRMAMEEVGEDSADVTTLTKEELRVLAIFRQASRSHPTAKAVIDDALTVAQGLLDEAFFQQKQG